MSAVPRVQALAESFLTADRNQIENAVDSVANLRGLSRCADREALMAAYPLPETERALKQLQQHSQSLAKLNGEASASNSDQLAVELELLLQQINDLHYPPLLAQGLLLQAQIAKELGNTELAKRAYYSASGAAVRARDNELAASAWVGLTNLLVNTENQLVEAQQVLQLSQAHVTQLPANHPLEGAFHLARAEILTANGSYRAALKQIQAAIAIARKTDHVSLAFALTQAAHVQTQLHELSAAQASSSEASSIAKATFGNEHPNYARTLSALVRINGLQGDNERALRYGEQILEIFLGAYGERHIDVVNTLERIAWNAKELGYYDQALRTSQRALQVENGFESPRPLTLALIHNTLGDVHISQGNYPEAVKELQASLQAVEESGHKPRLGLALNNLGNVANRASKFDEAKAYCERALVVDESYLAVDHPDLAYPLTCIGESLLGANLAKAALAPLARAHSLRNRPNFAPGSLAWTRWLYGRALWESGSDPALGERYVRFARRTFTQMKQGTKSELNDVEHWMRNRKFELPVLVD